MSSEDDGVAALLTQALLKRGVRGTNVSACLSAELGLADTVIFYVLALPLHNTFSGALLFHRGLVPFVIMFLSFCSLTIPMLKSMNVRNQRRSFRTQLLPETISKEITPDNAEAFQQHITSVAEGSRHSFLVTRVQRGLSHFRSRRNVQEVVTFLQTQSDIDAHAVFSSYKLIKVCIWAIPILGFVGTVVGIYAAVGGFSATINGAGELDTIKDSLGSVTTGLALAFDTTLLALLMSMVVMFPMSHFKKQFPPGI